MLLSEVKGYSAQSNNYVDRMARGVVQLLLNPVLDQYISVGVQISDPLSYQRNHRLPNWRMPTQQARSIVESVRLLRFRICRRHPHVILRT